MINKKTAIILFAISFLLIDNKWPALDDILVKYTHSSLLQQELFEKSKMSLGRYDNIRNRNIYSDLKLSTNTYDENIFQKLVKEDRSVFMKKENATILMLVRNCEIKEALASMRSLEDRFNWKYNYDWTFLNDELFTYEFKDATKAMASGNVNYELIPSEDWDCPSTINQTLYQEKLDEMEANGVIYGGSKSYRNMCRFNSGFFFRQEILKQYDYYFRVEPDVEYFCDFPYDPFSVMREKGKKYGFVMAIYDYENTIPTLWDTVEEYIDDKGHDNKIDMKNNAYKFLTDKEVIGVYGPYLGSNSDYNLCHFWSNFEIGDLNFFRSDKYIKFFNYLDSKEGFYYERWGDAPVHSIAVSLLLNRDEIIHFDELGYSHYPFDTCPTSYHLRVVQRCKCDYEADSNIAINFNSCLMRWWRNGSGKTFIKDT